MDLFFKYNTVIENLNNKSNIEEEKKQDEDEVIEKKNSFKCNNCGSNNYQNIKNQIICLDCGNILSFSSVNSIEITTESTILTPIDKLFFQTSKMNTIMRFKNPVLNQMQYWNGKHSEKSNKNIVKFLQINCDKLNLKQKILNDAVNLYFLSHTNIEGHKRILNHDNYIHVNYNEHIITRGKNKIGIIGACLYYACKKNNYLLDIKKIAEAFNVKPIIIHKGCKIFIEAIKKTKIDIDTNIVLPIHFINYIIDKLEIENSTSKKIKELIVKIQDNNLCLNHSPLSVCICSVLLYYKHINKKIFNKKISELFDISNVTINKTLTDLNQYKEFLFDNSITLTPSTSTVNKDIQNSINKKIQELQNINIHNYNQISNINPKSFFI